MTDYYHTLLGAAPVHNTHLLSGYTHPDMTYTIPPIDVYHH